MHGHWTTMKIEKHTQHPGCACCCPAGDCRASSKAERTMELSVPRAGTAIRQWQRGSTLYAWLSWVTALPLMATHAK
jgi:hypothetical protein